MELFPIQELSKTEEDLLLELVTNPVFKKYLQVRAQNIAAELSKGLIGWAEPQENWLRKEIYLKGQITILQSLADIEKVVAPTTQTN